MAPNRRPIIIWTNIDRIHWRIYAALGGDEIMVNDTHFMNTDQRVAEISWKVEQKIM